MIRALASTENLVAAGPMIGLLLKVTLLLGIAALGATVLQRRSAATRHFVWALALAGTLALPILGRVSPQWKLPIPAAIERPLRAALRDASPDIASQTSGGVPDRVASRSVATDGARAAADRRASRARSPESIGDRKSALDNRTGAIVQEAPAARWLRGFAVLWLAGAIAVLARLALGYFGLARLAHRATPLTGGTWRSLFDDARVRGGIAMPVRLCSSASVGAPVTWGWTSPVILLPDSAGDWPLEQRRVALDHELAHVARRDSLTQIGSAVVCALYWFHPFVWFAARRLRIESEHACDDRVLASGTSAPDYATHLLAVARGARRLRLAGAVAVCMARPSHLEGRLLSLLDDARPRGGLAARTRLVVGTLFAVLATLFAGLQPAARAAKSESDAASRPMRSADGETHRSSGDADPASTVEKSVAASPGERLTLDLSTGGDVQLRGWDENRVQVRALLDGADWRETQVDIERADDGVRVSSRLRRATNSSSTSHDFEIKVPRRFDLDVRSAGGGLTIVDVEGSLRGHTGGGEIVLDHVRGNVRLTTGGGEIRVTDTDARGSVTTGGGMVRLSRVRGGLQGSSGSGPVIYAETGDDDHSGKDAGREFGDVDAVQVDENGIEDARTDSHGVLHIERAGGDVFLREAPHGVEIQTGGGRIQVGRSAGRVAARTGGGEIEIGPVAGSVDAATGAGQVRVTLADAKGDTQSVEVLSGTGRIIVELPANFDGEFDLETAYTRDHGGATHIESPWKLDLEPTTDWDGSHGTPRRYVRAHGTAGKGRGLVQVRTVNGDIIVRRGAK